MAEPELVDHCVETTEHPPDHGGSAPHVAAAPVQGERRNSPVATRLLGQTLVERGAISSEDLAEALSRQKREEARLGDILLANGMVTSGAFHAALAERHRTVVADLGRDPPDVRLVDELGVEFCIRHGVLPWKRVGGAIVLICSRPDEFGGIAPRLPDHFGHLRLAVAPEADIQASLISLRHRDLARRAETRVDAGESCRTWQTRVAGRIGLSIVLALATLFAISPVWGFALLTAWAVLTLLINSTIKLVAAAMFIRRGRSPDGKRSYDAEPPAHILPTVSILVPLYKEREIAGRLVKRLSVLDYPRALLDICLIVEEDDTLTQATLARSNLPPWMRQIIVPRGTVRTKPRAMNFALDFCRGSIIGIYDAEDAPDPDQIHRIVDRFHEAGPWVACLQGVLDFYNARTNWLSRCFTIEYATWFRIVLPGMERMGFAVPLGGTTVFFRRAALESLGGWDAHNVTEDADLGIRLARRGFRTELIGTVTKEEANCRWWPWVKQRSRWIKGYAMTYGVHMRSPWKLLEELGPWKFAGVQFLFLGTLSQFVLAPFLWSFWLVAFGLPHPLVAVMPGWMFIALGATFLASEVLTIATGILAVSGREHRFLRWWVPTMHLYFPLASVAAAKGLAEIVAKPFYWDKTQHGHADFIQDTLDAVTGPLKPADAAG
ncbi:glycosyltransferase family 2 protein [Maritimibacter dapengensis]|uniref:Glycosyltransferase n=1 Tax=Maritimibacter dapengensis TaxID=2836868 RepID=A0ABS6T0E4_9RHOB|nr:glycosyltransferase family 2 protein [Maritimibacter dapengensis]MBV7378703.1 glycosyltransferase [Maritimibacter dapengensis]